MKITRVANLELATRQVKKLQEKSRHDKTAEILGRVATLQLFARACDETKEYLADECLFIVPRSLEVCDSRGLQFVARQRDKI